MTTVELTDAQLAQFTACGVIVVDGEAVPIWAGPHCSGWNYLAPEPWRKLTDQVVTLTATCPLPGDHDEFTHPCIANSDGSGLVDLGRFTIRLLPVVETVPAVASSDPIEGPTVAFTDSQFPRELFIRHDGVIDSLGYPGPLPQPGQWCVQFEAAP